MSDETTIPETGEERRARIEALAAEPDVAAAINAAKGQIAQQYAAFGIEPEVYVIEACGLPCVLLPWSNQKRLMAVRATSSLPDMEKGLKLSEAVVTDCLFWIRGQADDARTPRAAALNRAKGLADLVGGRYMNLILQIGGEMMTMLGSEEAQPAGKKL